MNSKIRQVTDYAKDTKIGNKIFTHNTDYKSEIKRLRGIWKKLAKRSSPNSPGMDLKKELQKNRFDR